MKFALPLIISFLLTIAASTFNLLPAQSFVFASLDGSPMNTTGWNLQGAAYVGNTGSNTGNNELVLVNPVLSSSGSVFFAAPINLAQCRKWIAEFEFRIADGNAADGLSFCYLDVPPSGFVSGGGLGIPGTANGLKICIDTWRNCGNDAVPKVQIRYGVGYDECNGQPTRDNNDGALNFIRNGNYHTCKITYDNGNIIVEINGVEYLRGNQNFNFTGYFGFTASTGGFFDRHSIRQVKIFTEMPPSEAGNAVAGCSGSQFTLGSLATAGYTYAWSPAIGLSNVNTSNPEIILPPNRADTMRLQYVVETGFANLPGCFSRDSVLVTVLPTANPAFAWDSICSPQTAVQFANRTSYASRQALASDAQWQWNAQPIGGGAIQTSAQYSPVINFVGTADHKVDLKVTTQAGCTSDTSIVVKAVFQRPQLSISAPVSACEGSAITAQAVLTNTAPAPNNYYWQLGDGNQATGKQITHSYSSAGNFRMTVYADGLQGCQSDTAVQMIRIASKPLVSIVDSPDSACLNDRITLLAGSPDTNIVSWTWQVGANVNLSGNPVSTTLASSGNTAIAVRATNSFGCTNSVATAVRVGEPPVLSAGPDRQTISGNPVRLLGEADTLSTNIVWTPATGIANPDVLQPLAMPLATTQYRINGSNGFCDASDEVIVVVFPELKVPNAFSPNSDGINDVWNIAGLNTYQEISIRIFDRYGRVVYAASDYNRPWDGTQNGAELPTGVYYYIIELTKGFGTLQGSVTMLR